MKLVDIYNAVVEKGIVADPRGRDEVERALARTKTAYDKMSDDDKEFFDTERLKNPYSDTRISLGDPDQEIRGLICGIDMQVGEVTLADRMREKGELIDLIFAHHPEGQGYANLDEVMGMQADLWNAHGVGLGRERSHSPAAGWGRQIQCSTPADSSPSVLPPCPAGRRRCWLRRP